MFYVISKSTKHIFKLKPIILKHVFNGGNIESDLYEIHINHEFRIIKLYHGFISNTNGCKFNFGGMCSRPLCRAQPPSFLLALDRDVCQTVRKIANHARPMNHTSCAESLEASYRPTH